MDRPFVYRAVVALAVMLGLGSGGASASLIPAADAAFDSTFLNSPTNTGFDATSNSNDPYGYWWTADAGDGDKMVRIASGGNPDACATRGGGHAGRAKAIAYVLKDLKTTTGTASLSFDVYLDNAPTNSAFDTEGVRVTVYGISDYTDWGTGQFDMNAGTSSSINNMSVPSNALSLASMSLATADFAAYQTWYTKSFDVGLGSTGYDVLVIRIAEAGVEASDGLRFDNIQVTPEPATLALLGAGLLGAGVIRRRRRK